MLRGSNNSTIGGGTSGTSNMNSSRNVTASGDPLGYSLLNNSAFVNLRSDTANTNNDNTNSGTSASYNSFAGTSSLPHHSQDQSLLPNMATLTPAAGAGPGVSGIDSSGTGQVGNRRSLSLAQQAVSSFALRRPGTTTAAGNAGTNASSGANSPSVGAGASASQEAMSEAEMRINKMARARYDTLHNAFSYHSFSSL